MTIGKFDFKHIEEQTRQTIDKAKRALDERGITKTFGSAVETVSTISSGAYDAGKKGYALAKETWLRQKMPNATVDAALIILNDAEPAFEQLQEKVGALQQAKGTDPLAAEFFERLETQKAKRNDIFFKEQRGARNCRLAVDAMARAHKNDGEDLSAFKEIRALAYKVEQLYKNLPDEYVAFAKAIEAKKYEVSANIVKIFETSTAVAEQGLEKGLESGKKQWSNLRGKLGF